VVVGEIEARGRPRHRLPRVGEAQVPELVAGQLDDEHVEAAGIAHASSTGTPMLPHGAARRPPATSIVAVSWVVVVLPFVPVISTHSAGCRPAEHLVAHAPGELDVAPERDRGSRGSTRSPDARARSRARR
jgi:hypothetical protein